MGNSPEYFLTAFQFRFHGLSYLLKGKADILHPGVIDIEFGEFVKVTHIVKDSGVPITVEMPVNKV